MKKLLVILLLVAMTLGGCSTNANGDGNPFKPELVATVDGDPEAGADAYENSGDHANSIYFTHPDFYNMVSNETLTIISNYSPTIQTTEWSCGPSAAHGILNHLGITGYNEMSIAEAMGFSNRGTAVGELHDFFVSVDGVTVFDTSYIANPTAEQLEDGEIIPKWTVDSLYDGTFVSFIKENLENNRLMLVEWMDWDGHWQTIIGYDDMGTESVGDDMLIFADPYDTSDHWQDGYYTYPLERFFYVWHDRNVAYAPYTYQQYIVVEIAE